MTLLSEIQSMLRRTREAEMEGYIKEAIKYHKESNHQKRLSSLNQALKLCDMLKKDNPLDFITKKIDILVSMANACGYLYRHGEKIKYLTEALEVINETPESNSLDRINRFSVLINLGCAYGKIMNYHKKIEFLSLAFEMYDYVYSIETVELADLKYNLGSAYGKLGDISKQIELQQDAIRIYETILPTKNKLKIANVLNSIGSAYAKNGQYELAISAQTTALEIARKILGDNDINVAITLNSLGNSYKIIGNYEEQIKLHLEALSILQRVAPNNYMIGAIFNNLAIAHGELGDTDNQEIYFDRALEFSIRTLEEGDRDTEILQYNLDIVRGNIGEFRIVTLFSEWISEIFTSPYLAEGRQILEDVASITNLILSMINHIPIKEGEERISMWILDVLLEFQETLQQGVFPPMAPSMDSNPGNDYDGGACSSDGPPCASSPTHSTMSLGGSTNTTDDNFKEYPHYA